MQITVEYLANRQFPMYVLPNHHKRIDEENLEKEKSVTRNVPTKFDVIDKKKPFVIIFISSHFGCDTHEAHSVAWM